MNEPELIPTEWRFADDLLHYELYGVTIHHQVSPFYPGIRYAVRCGGSVLSIDGKWEWEPLPSSRDDEFYRRFRFPSFEAASAAARKARKEATR